VSPPLRSTAHYRVSRHTQRVTTETKMSYVYVCLKAEVQRNSLSSVGSLFHAEKAPSPILRLREALMRDRRMARNKSRDVNGLAA